MSFSKKGAPLGALEEQSIRFFFRIYFEFWLIELYSENYINEIYKLELKQFVISATELQDIQQNNSISLERQEENNFITGELRNLQNLNTWINKVFSFHYLSIDDVKEFKRRFEYQDNISRHNEDTNFIKKYRGLLRERSKSELVTVFQQKFQDVSNEVMLYFLVVMYLDLLRTEDFLKDKYNSEIQEQCLPKSSKVSIEQIQQGKKNQEKKPTATQWALYHYILQECEPRIKPRFSDKKKEFQELEKEYGRHWNNLQIRWNLINNAEGQEGYRKEDVVVVERLLKNQYPEALPKLQEVSKKLF